MRSLRASTRRWLGAVALGGMVLVGGTWYAAANHLTGSVPMSLVSGAFAQEASAPAPSTPPAPPKHANAQANSRKPTGQVTQITTEPASFTLRTAAGTDMTFSVLDTTVFMAGHDRPYRFELLKTGDQVVVRGGGQGKAPNAAASTAPDGAVATARAAKPNGKGKAKPARANQANTAPNGTPIARQVMVRPAGEQKPKRNKPEQTNQPEPAAVSTASTVGLARIANGGDHGAGQ